MDKLSYRRHRFPRIVIQQAVWLYFRFALSYRDVEDMLAERGIDVSYETVRRWALKFGTIIARKLRRGRPRPDGRWHLRRPNPPGLLFFPKQKAARRRSSLETLGFLEQRAAHLQRLVDPPGQSVACALPCPP